jgi:hypothetical protein
VVLRGVSVHWIIYVSDRCISALDSTWFWEEYLHWIVRGSDRSISTVDSTWLW